MPKARTVTPTKRPGGKPLQEWARNVLEKMAGSLAPAPRIQVVIVDEKEVLVIGVARAPALVPCIENGELKYYLRIGDATLEMAPYLISDLVLGRRVHPQLTVSNPIMGYGALNNSTIQFRVEIENESFVPANDVIIGIVALGLNTPNAEVASPFLLRFIDCSKDRKCEGHGDSLEPIHRTSRINQEKRLNLSAFEKNSVGGIGYFTIPKPNKPIPMRSALYVLASGHPPEWYQFDWVLPDTDNSTLTISPLTRTYTEGPMVAWNQEWRQP